MKHEGRGDDETTRSGLFFEAIRVISEMREFDLQQKGDVIDADIRPRFAIYENVEGAFSSNAGCDFQAVLTELIRVKEPDAPDVPLPEKGKWGRAGYLYDDMGKWSVAWLLHDAQYHGVAQRRKRVCVCADYGGLDAGRMLFEPELHRKAENPDRDEALADLGMGCAGEVSTLTARLSRNSAPGGEAGQGPAPGTESRSGAAGDGAGRIYLMDSIGGQAESYAETDIANTLKATLGINCGMTTGRNGVVVSIAPKAFCLQGNGIDRADTAGCNGKGWTEDVSYTINTVDRHAVCTAFAQNQRDEVRDLRVAEQADKPVLVYDACGGDDGSVSPCIVGDHNNPVTDMTAIVIEPASTAYTLQIRGGCEGGGKGPLVQTEKSATLGTSQTQTLFQISTDTNPTISCEVFHCTAEEDLTGPLKARDYKDPMIVAVDCRNLAETPMSGTLQAKENGGQSLNYTNPVRVESIVRRLTPIECERLQYFPDNWSAVGILPDGSEKVMSDSTRYKLQGNSIARPFWRNLCARISSLYTQYTPTLGSLFDGQGGFPLCWAEINGPDACRWSSEIVEDAAAVTRKHFGDEDLGTKGDYYTAIKRQFMPLPIVGQAVTDKTSDKSKNQSMEGNAMIEIHVSLSASNLEDAINRLADALESTGIAAVPGDPKKRSRKKADAQPVAEAQPEVQPDSILPPPIVEPVAAPVVEPVAEPAIPETTYTRDQIARCGADLIDKGQRAALLDILKQHGVRAIPQLPDDQTVLSAIAADLRALGGDI